MQAAFTWATRICLALLMAGALGHAALRLRLITDPRVDLGGAEINVVYGTQKLLLGRPLYTDPESPPFEAIQLAPLFHLCCAGIAGALGIDALDTTALFAVGRGFALVLNLAAAWLVFLLSRRAGAARSMALAAACIGLAMITEHSFGRSDALATPLVLAALLVALARDEAPIGWWRAVGVAGLCALAVLAKQTAIVAPLLIAAHLALNRDRPSLKRLVIAGSGTAIAALALLLSMATPEVLWMNLVGAVQNGIAPSMFRELFDQGIYKYHAGWHALTLLGGAMLMRQLSQRLRLLGIAALGLFVVGLASGFKSGSGLNYLVDGQLIALAGGAAWMAGRTERQASLAALAFVAYGTLFMQHRLRLLSARVGTEEMRAGHARALAADRAVHAWLLARWGDDSARPVLITYRGHLELLLNGVALLPQKDIIQWSTEPPFDLGRLKAMLDGGQVKMVVADAPMERLRLLGWSYPLDPVAEVHGRRIYRIGAD